MLKQLIEPTNQLRSLSENLSLKLLSCSSVSSNAKDSTDRIHYSDHDKDPILNLPKIKSGQFQQYESYLSSRVIPIKDQANHILFNKDKKHERKTSIFVLANENLIKEIQ